MIPRLSTPVFILAAMVAVSLLWSPPDAKAQKSSRSNPGKPAALPKAAATYSCPMHPEVKSARSGRCPKCGMDLKKGEPIPEPKNESVSDAEPIGVGARLNIPDTELLDQDGRKIHFYHDLVQDRVVAINFIFTTCTTICPPLGATFARVQKEFGDRAGRDVSFISISVDPVTDTPERLKAWAAKFHAAPTWTFVTGDKLSITGLLRALGASTDSPQNHSPTVLIVNDRRGQWTRAYGLAPPSQLVKLINDAIEGRLETQEAAQQ